MNRVPQRKLSEISNIVMGQSPSSNYVFDDLEHGLAFLQGCAEFGKKFPNPLKSCSNGPKKANKGSTLISVRAPVGDTNLADRDFIIGRGLASIEANGIDANYLSFAINFSKDSLQRVSQGSTFSAIGSKDINDLQIPVFELNEQKKIAEILTSIDEQIASTEKLIEKKKNIKRGLIDQLIFRDFDAKMDIPVQGNIEVLTGYPFNSQEFNVDGHGFPLLRIRDISSSTTEVSYSGQIPDGYWVEKSDVLIGMDGEFNLRVWSGVRALLNQRVMRLRELPHSQMSLKYLTYYLPNFLRDIENKTPQTTVKHLSHLTVLNAKFRFPDRAKQDKVASIINSVDCLIDVENMNLEKLKFKKQGLMQDLLTGKVRAN